MFQISELIHSEGYILFLILKTLDTNLSYNQWRTTKAGTWKRQFLSWENVAAIYLNFQYYVSGWQAISILQNVTFSLSNSFLQVVLITSTSKLASQRRKLQNDTFAIRPCFPSHKYLFNSNKQRKWKTIPLVIGVGVNQLK